MRRTIIALAALPAVALIYTQSGVGAGDRRLLPKVCEADGPQPLHEAARLGRRTDAERLLATGADSNARDYACGTPLHYAVRFGHRDVAALLLAHGANPALRNDIGEDALQIAACYGNLDMTQLLVGHGVDVNAPGLLGETPLHCLAGGALLDGRGIARDTAVALTKVLLDGGADVHARDAQGKTSLHAAAAGSFGEVVDLLVAAGADTSATDDDMRTPAHYSAIFANVDALRALAARGADVNAKDEDGDTALSTAIDYLARVTEPEARARALDYAHVILGLGAAAEACCLLHQAAATGIPELAVALLRHGASPSQTDDRGRTPLDVALQQRARAGEPDHVGVVRLLVNERAPHDPRWNLLGWAAREGDLETGTALLAAGTDPEAEAIGDIDSIGSEPPLYHAAWNGHLPFVDLLLTYGADANARDAIGSTALHAASLRGRADIVEVLLRAGADPNAVNRAGDAPLHLAAGLGRADAVRVLLAAGARTDLKDDDGRTPLRLAELRGHEPVAELLRR